MPIIEGTHGVLERGVRGKGAHALTMSDSAEPPKQRSMSCASRQEYSQGTHGVLTGYFEREPQTQGSGWVEGEWPVLHGFIRVDAYRLQGGRPRC